MFPSVSFTLTRDFRHVKLQFIRTRGPCFSRPTQIWLLHNNRTHHRRPIRTLIGDGHNARYPCLILFKTPLGHSIAVSFPPFALFFCLDFSPPQFDQITCPIHLSIFLGFGSDLPAPLACFLAIICHYIHIDCPFALYTLGFLCSLPAPARSWLCSIVIVGFSLFGGCAWRLVAIGSQIMVWHRHLVRSVWLPRPCRGSLFEYPQHGPRSVSFSTLAC